MPEIWTRRGVLRLGAALALTPVAGCGVLGGGEKDLLVTNTTQASVTVEVTVVFVPDDETIIQTSDEVPAGEQVFYPNVLSREGSYRVHIRVRNGPSSMYTAGPTNRPVEARITETSVKFYAGSPGSKTGTESSVRDRRSASRRE